MELPPLTELYVNLSVHTALSFSRGHYPKLPVVQQFRCAFRQASEPCPRLGGDFLADGICVPPISAECR